MAILLDDINIKTACAECGTPLWGVNLHRRGDLFYCSADFERLSPEESLANEQLERELDIYKSMFDGTGIGDLVRNGGFDSDTSWAKGIGWSISGGTASSDGSQSGGDISELSQAATKIIHAHYIYTFTVSDYSAGSVAIQVADIIHSLGVIPTNTYAYGTARTADGTYTETIRQVFDNSFNRIAADANFVGSIDNFSVRRVSK